MCNKKKKYKIVYSSRYNNNINVNSIVFSDSRKYKTRYITKYSINDDKIYKYYVNKDLYISSLLSEEELLILKEKCVSRTFNYDKIKHLLYFVKNKILFNDNKVLLKLVPIKNI